jgi:acetyl-CoA decarbonylase/synthase complex subunit epsilon
VRDMATTEPWQTAEIAGPKKATTITKPEVVAALIKQAKRPILVVGHKAAETQLEHTKLLDYIIELADKADIPVVATAQVVSEFFKRGRRPAGWMPAVDISNRLTDPDWCGLDGKGPYDVALFVGLPYYMEWTILSGLKHFAPNLKTITLDNGYQPNASWSFPNTNAKNWTENLRMITEKVGGK